MPLMLDAVWPVSFLSWWCVLFLYGFVALCFSRKDYLLLLCLCGSRTLGVFLYFLYDTLPLTTDYKLCCCVVCELVLWIWFITIRKLPTLYQARRISCCKSSDSLKHALSLPLIDPPTHTCTHTIVYSFQRLAKCPYLASSLQLVWI